MTKKTGRLQTFLIGKEDEWGVKASSFIAIPVDEFNFNEKVEKINDESARGRKEKNFGSHVSKKYAEPSLSAKIRSNGVGILLLATLGESTPSLNTPETGVHTHNFSFLNSDTQPSFTLVFDDGIVQRMVRGAVLNSFDLDFVLEDFGNFSASFVSQFPESTSEAFAEDTTDKFFAFDHLSVKFASNLAGLDGAGAVDLESAKISFNKNAKLNYKFGSTEPCDALCGDFEVLGDFEASFEDETHRDNFVSNVLQAIRFELVNSGVTIGEGSHPTIQVDFAKTSLNDWGENVPLDDKITQTFGFNPEFSLADGMMVSARVVNVVEGY